MSTFKVPLLRIQSVSPHPNADRLDLALVAESPVVVGKGQYKEGETVIYVPVGAVLPQTILDDLTASGSKISIPNGRIKAAKIRGIISQGLILDPRRYDICSAIGSDTVGEAIDVSQKLGIVKYEEKPRNFGTPGTKTKRVRPGNPNFRYYTDIENIKHFPTVLKQGEPVWVTEKLHGTSFRCGWFKKDHYSLWDRLKKFFGFEVGEWEFCYGSRKVDITAASDYRGFYGEDIYGKIAKKYDLRNRLPKGYALYGEICGPGIQKDYDYGLKEHELFVYDVMDTETLQWLPATHALKLIEHFHLRSVPVLGSGIHYDPFNTHIRYSDNLFSTIDPKTVREGIVIKPLEERIDNRVGRVILKVINPAYLLKDTTEYQ